VLLGDFNADPYEPEMSGLISGLFAVRDRSDLVSREAHGIQRQAIFNPMWQLLKGVDFSNNTSTAPPGTYRILGNSHISWRILDQILVSKPLAARVNSDPEIVCELIVNGQKVPLYVKGLLKPTWVRLFCRWDEDRENRGLMAT
jgi:hypothetical protein